MELVYDSVNEAFIIPLPEVRYVGRNSFAFLNETWLSRKQASFGSFMSSKLAKTRALSTSCQNHQCIICVRYYLLGLFITF